MNITIIAGDRLVRTDTISRIDSSSSSTEKSASAESAASSSNGSSGTGSVTTTTGTLPSSTAESLGTAASSFAETLSSYTGRTIGGNIKSTDLASMYTLEDSFQQAAKEYGVSADLLKAIAKKESNIDPTCVSSSGAIGIMQLMPSTALSMGVQDASDPHQNIMGAAKYLSGLLEEFNGNTNMAIAAYNKGSGAVRAAGGVPYSAQGYVNSVLSNMKNGVEITNTRLYRYSTATEEDIKNDINKMLAGTYSLASRDDFIKAYHSALDDYDEEYDVYDDGDDEDYDDDVIELTDAQREYNRVLTAANVSINQIIEKLQA